jgi:hypothetical protein
MIKAVERYGQVERTLSSELSRVFTIELTGRAGALARNEREARRESPSSLVVRQNCGPGVHCERGRPRFQLASNDK